MRDRALLSTPADQAAVQDVSTRRHTVGRFDPAQHSAISVEQWRAIRAESAASVAVLAERTGCLTVLAERTHGLTVGATSDGALREALAGIQARVR